jgi:hypothetical protein
MKDHIKPFGNYIKEQYGSFDFSTWDQPFHPVNFKEMSEYLEDDGRVEMIIKGVLGGDNFIQTSEGEFSDGLEPIGQVTELPIRDLGLILNIFDTDLQGKKQKVVEIKFMGGDTQRPIYIFSDNKGR